MTLRLISCAVTLLCCMAADGRQLDTVRDFDVIKGAGDQKYLYFAERRYWVRDAEVLESLGYLSEDVKSVPQHELLSLPEGKPVQEVNLPYRLIKGKGPSVFLVLDHRRILIADLHSFLVLGFDGNDVEYLTEEQVKAIPLAGVKSGIVGMQIGTAPAAKPEEFGVDGVTRAVPSSAARMFVECIMKNRRGVGAVKSNAGTVAAKSDRGTSAIVSGKADGDAQ